jgi:NADH:ubiquinone oxidoreductase subunit H
MIHILALSNLLQISIESVYPNANMEFVLFFINAFPLLIHLSGLMQSLALFGHEMVILIHVLDLHMNLTTLHFFIRTTSLMCLTPLPSVALARLTLCPNVGQTRQTLFPSVV